MPVEGLPGDPELLASFADLRFGLAHPGHSELQTAVRDELLASNSAARITQPGVPRTGGHHLSIAEVAYPPLLRLLVAKGLLHGEALASGWSDVELTDGLLRVRGTL